LTESHVRERLARMSDNPIVVAELRTYERGWFSSTAKVDVGLEYKQFKHPVVACHRRTRAAIAAVVK